MFSKAIDILLLAKKEGIEISLNGDELHVQVPKNRSFNKDLISEIKGNKQNIVDFLKSSSRINSHYSKIEKFDRSQVQLIPASFAQQRIWFIHMLEGSITYHIPAVLRLSGSLNAEALERSLGLIVDRHEVLRTVFGEQEGNLYQSVKEKNGWHLNVVDGSIQKENIAGLRNYIHNSINRPFDLSKDYMLRAELIRLAEDEHVLVVVMHHIASDAWSMPIIIKELAELYSSFVEGRNHRLSPLQLQYADYAVWEHNFLTPELLDVKLQYWKDKLADVSPLQLPTDFKRPALRSTSGAACTFEIDQDLLSQLHRLSQQESSSLYMVLLSVFKVLLYRYSGQQDISVGTSIANRTQQEIEGLVGFFVNTLVFRDEVRGNATFLELLRQVRATTLGAYEHQEVSFEKVVEAVVKERDPSVSPLFQVMLVLQNTPEA
ncbi:MAG TPA: condensation domain-containing protein, partial [Segetibacter sp.]|nr:condensation domain-containing protein [Segetibacter sp.]